MPVQEEEAEGRQGHASGASNVIASLSKKQRKFRAGQTVEVWVSAPNFNTKVARLVLQEGQDPDDAAVLRAAGPVEGAEDLHLSVS